MNGKARVLSTIAAAVIGPTIAIGHYYYLNHKRKNHRNTTGTEDAVLNILNSGDLIFFRRSPYNYPISVGLAINLYQRSHQSTVDHCGIIIEDNIGRPFVYELTSTGPKLTPYVTRISESLSDYIVLLPLLKKNVNDVNFRQQLFQNAIARKNKNESLSEAIEIYKGALIPYLSKPELASISPSVDFVLQSLHDVGVEFPEENRKKVLCDELILGQYQPVSATDSTEPETAGIEMSTATETETEGETGGEIYKFGEMIVIRSM